MAVKSPWWKKEKGQYVTDPVHAGVFRHVQALEQDQNDIHVQNVLNCSLYSNREPARFSWHNESRGSFRPMNPNLENVIQSVCDALRSRVGKNRPKATPVSRGSDFETYLKARLLDRYLYGEFLRQDVYPKGEDVFLDACIYGTGFLKLDIDGGDIFSERVNPDEIIVDQRECISGCYPSNLFQRKLVSRFWLHEAFGGDKDLAPFLDEIPDKKFFDSHNESSDDMVLLVEGWHLGSGGRHVICAENVTLLDEAYTRDKFPFAVFRWNKAPTGFYGRSLVEDLTGYQIRLNELNEVIRVGQDMMCVPRIFVDQGSAIVKTQFDNSVGRIVSFRGNPPIAETWNAFNTEIYNERDRVRQAAFEFARISPLSAQSKLPSQARLDSSEAIREYSAVEDEGFSHQTQAFEKFYLDIAEHIIELSTKLYKNQKKDRKNFFRARNIIQQINWSDLDLEREAYTLQISASSILNMTPAARKDKLNSWAASGVITPDQYKAWSGEPDLERLADLMSAANDHIELQIDKMLDGIPQTPDPLDNLAAGLRTVNDTYLHLKALETPDGILQGFRDWLELAEALMNPPQQGAPMMPPPGVDPATGMPLPPGLEDPNAPPMMPPGSPEMGPNGIPLNQLTGAPAPSVSTPAAQAFLG